MTIVFLRTLRQQLFNHTPTRLAQLLESPRVEISQFVVVQTEQVENRSVNVLERVRDFDGFLADFIRRADDVAGFHAAAGEPHHLTFGVVVAAELHATAADAVVG